MINIGQLSLYFYVSYLNIPLLYMVFQEVVFPLKVSHSFIEVWVPGYRDGTGVITHEGNSLKDHSKVSHGMHNHRIWEQQLVATYSPSVVD
jgi:hypothetical protein